MESVVETDVNWREIVEQQNEKIAKLEALIQHYEDLLLNAKRRQFGPSSERMEGQLSLFGDPVIPPPPEPETEDITYKRKKRKGKREEDISNLPIVRIDHELPENEQICPKCDVKIDDIGVNITYQIGIIPAKAVLEEHAVHSYACHNPECEGNDKGNTIIVKAEAPKPLISGSLASPSLVAHIAYQKYSNGMPLYRLEKGFQYDGVNVSRQTMSNWVIKCAFDYLFSIYMLMISYFLKETVAHADETTVQVLNEPNRKPQTKSYEWVYRTSGYSKYKIIIYDYKETRQQEHPKEFLKDFKGYLHTDGYQAYHNLPGGIVVVGCWFHCRQYFEHMYKNLPKEKRKGSEAEKGLGYIGALFDLERKFKELSPDERYKKRLEKSKPIADAFFAWAGTIRALPKSPLGKAVDYALSQRKYLENVFLDGRLEFSNNRCERSVKKFVMGRKAWLFSNTPDGATASSIMYSIIETAQENGLHPFRYVKFLLETLPNATANEVERLLPWSDELPDECRIPAKKGEPTDAKKNRDGVHDELCQGVS